MSIQWTFIAGYLYFEIAVVLIMISPIFSARRWNQFFKSRIFVMFRENAAVYFYVLLGVLCLFLFDAVREMRKYSHTSESGHVHISTEMKGNVKLFRAQRNFYITGFAIFLAFVIKRLVSMLITQGELSLKAEEVIKEAKATVKLAKSTVLANTFQTNELQNYGDMKQKLEATESLLKEEIEKVMKLEDDVNKWKLKYEEATSKGKGDE